MSFNTTPYMVLPVIKIIKENWISYNKEVSAEITQIQEIFGRLNLMH